MGEEPLDRTRCVVRLKGGERRLKTIVRVECRVLTVSLNAFLACALVKPISISIETCSAGGAAAPPADLLTMMGSSISITIASSAPNPLQGPEKVILRTGILHMPKQPLHRCLRIPIIPSGKQCLLAPNQREAHCLQLTQSSFVELWQPSSTSTSSGLVWEWRFAIFETGAQMLRGELENIVGWEDDGDVEFGGDPVNQLELLGMDDEDFGERRELGLPGGRGQYSDPPNRRNT
jgi:hypothetical protein